MQNPIWRFGVVANITEYHIIENEKQNQVTKRFKVGTKVYLGVKLI